MAGGNAVKHTGQEEMQSSIWQEEMQLSIWQEEMKDCEMIWQTSVYTKYIMFIHLIVWCEAYCPDENEQSQDEFVECC